jgi:SPP1 gp7 family putative phage head morphogenesis protein
VPDPEVIRSLRRWKDLLRARDARQAREMARRWLGVETALNDGAELLANELIAQRDTGIVINELTVFRSFRYRQLLDQTREAIGVFNHWADGEITAEQAVRAQLGIDHGASALRKLGLSTDAFTRLPFEAVENMIGVASDGSPLSNLLSEAFPDAVEGMTQSLINAIAAGNNPRQTAQEMLNGTTRGLNRALLIARDQQNRVYRTTNAQQYAESGVVVAHRRVATHDDRVCAACLLAEGEILPPGQPVYDHPQGRCTSVPVISGLPEIEYEKGSAWLRRQSEATQRAILGPGRWEKWRSGEVTDEQLVTQTNNVTWGRGLQPTPLKNL